MNEVEEFCRKHGACEDGEEWASQYETLADVYDNCPRGDWLLWMLRNARMIKKQQAVQCAVDFAERVLPIFEKRSTDDPRPRAAIDAARAWLANQCVDTAASIDAAEAARAADDAADDAASAAAYTAASAAADAVRAAYAAYAAEAARAAHAAASYAYAAAYDDVAAADVAIIADEEQQAQADIVRRVVPNPWVGGQ